MATASLVLGIIAICTSFIPIINNMSFIMAIIGLIFAIVSLIKRTKKGMCIASIIICILAMAMTLSAQKTLSDGLNEVSKDLSESADNISGDNTEKILKNNLKVDIGDFKISKGSYGLIESSLPVKVKNKGSEKKSFMIQIEAVTSKGARITTDTIYVNNINAGQSQKFKAFQYVSDDDYKQMKKAKFKIVEVSMY